MLNVLYLTEHILIKVYPKNDMRNTHPFINNSASYHPIKHNYNNMEKNN